MSKVLQRKIGSFTDIHIGLGQDSTVWHDSVLKFAEKTSNFYKEKKLSQNSRAQMIFYLFIGMSAMLPFVALVIKFVILKFCK